MKDSIDFKQSADASVSRPVSRPGFKGLYTVEHVRNGQLLTTKRATNAVVNEGKNNILDVAFSAATQITAWHMLLIDNAGYTALAVGDTYDAIDQAGNGWDEFKTYTDAGNSDSTTTRPEWAVGAPASQAISNGSQVIFDITGTATVKGLALVGAGAGVDTKGNHASDGILWATALFDQGDTAVINGDQLRVTYTISVS